VKVGWIGLGQIGRVMAFRVLAAGHTLVGHARDLDKNADLAAASATLTTSVVEAARDADVLGINVFNDAQLIDSLVEGGALAAMRPGSVVAVHSTGDASVLQDVAARAPQGVALLDATFSGSAEATRAGKLTLLIGGDPQALETARPVLESYASNILPVGGVGAARKLKLLNNMLFAAQVSLSVEAVRAAEQMGIDGQAAAKAIGVSSGASFAMEMFARDRPMDQILAGVARYLDKDADLARAAARDAGIALPLLDHAAQWGARRPKP
jgi:3-hydroxyisobutyrate dehydrogenase-like beta-hydroxyacid dehydrogenase